MITPDEPQPEVALLNALDDARDASVAWKNAYRYASNQRDDLQARIDAALNHDPLHGASEGLHCGGMAPCIRNILTTPTESGEEQ